MKQANSEKIIFIGVGHGGGDPGAVNGTRRESDDNLRLAQAVAKEIMAQGHRAVLSRVADISMTPEQRRQAAVAAGADILLDLHRNSFADPAAKGIEIWIRNMAHTMAATLLLEELCRVEHQANRGVKVGGFQVLYNTPMPAMLLELGFISNLGDNRLYDKYFAQNAKAIAKGLLAALGESWREEDGSGAAENLIRLQLGAFREEANARTLQKELQEKGYDCFLVLPQTPGKQEG